MNCHLLILLFGLSGCVSARKYDKLTQITLELAIENTTLKIQKSFLEFKVSNCEWQSKLFKELEELK